MTIVFGRFNPPTIGHKLVLDKAHLSLETMWFILRDRMILRRILLNPAEKSEIMKKMFPQHSDSIVNDEKHQNNLRCS